MAKQLKVHPNNEEFREIMKRAVLAIHTKNDGLLAKVKEELASYDASIFYNDQLDSIRIYIKDRPFVDLSAKLFTDIEYKK
jgi:hypothetical protein